MCVEYASAVGEQLLAHLRKSRPHLRLFNDEFNMVRFYLRLSIAVNVYIHTDELAKSSDMTREVTVSGFRGFLPMSNPNVQHESQSHVHRAEEQNQYDPNNVHVFISCNRLPLKTCFTPDLAVEIDVLMRLGNRKLIQGTRGHIIPAAASTPSELTLTLCPINKPTIQYSERMVPRV